MLFFVTYVAFEIPWVMAIKRFGANRVLATAMVTWSITTLGTGFIKNYHQGIACRLLLGVFEAGLFPCLTFLISLIYSREQQAKRVCALFAGSAISGAFGGLIAYGIQLMGDRHGLSAWRWLFIVEGIISLGLGGIAWITMPKNAENAWFLTEDEKALMRARKQRDAVYKGADEFSWSYVKMAFMDPFVYLASLGLFTAGVPLFGFNLFLPTIIKGLG
jgi:MFS family permease